MDIEKALKISKSMQLSHERSSKLLQSESQEIQAISFNKSKSQMSNNHQVNNNQVNNKYYQNNHHSRNRSRSNRQQRQRSQSQRRNTNISNPKCGRCGQMHRNKCPAMGVVCNNCNKRNHFSKYCLFRNVSMIENEFVIGTLESNYIKNSQDWKINIQCNNYNLLCQIDTGAEINVISKYNLQKINCNTRILKSNNKLYSFSGNRIPTIGACYLLFYLPNNVVSKIYFIVANIYCQTVISGKTCERLGIIKRIFSLTNSHRDHCRDSQTSSINNSRSQSSQVKSSQIRSSHIYKRFTDVCLRYPFTSSSR